MKTICFDLDGTLCTNTNGNYMLAEPIKERVNVVNGLYDKGNTIIIDTARGTVTGIEWTDVTIKQLEKWGVKYHTLRVGEKIDADVFVDDKGINDNLFFDNRTIGESLDIFIKNKVKSILDKDKFPEYDNIFTDTLSELIDKLCIVHIRYWYLEDAMASCDNDEELVQLRKKSESLFKEKRPMLIAGFDKLIMKILNGELGYTSVNTKHYKGWEQKD
jgi:hypothetical protein